MKKIKLGLIILGIFILTGCVKYDLQMTVEGDKGFAITVIDAMQNEYYTESDDDSTKKEYEALGYEVESYKTDTYTGLKLTKRFDNIDLVSSPTCGQVEITKLLELNSEELTLFKSSKQGSITTYTADFTYDLTIDTTNAGSEEIDYSEYASSMSFSYSISLPTNATIISSNAEEISTDGHVLTWTVEYGKKEDIDFTFSIDETKKGDTTKIEDENTQKEEEKDENSVIEEEKTVEEKVQPKEEFSFRTLIFALIAIALFLGIILLKIKTYNNSNKNDSGLGHTQPPNLKK